MTPTGVLGGPLFRLPWGFHFRACFVALSGCFLNCMRVTNPFQFSWPHLCLNGFLTCLLPKIFIRYSVCPRYLQDSSQTFVDKCLQLVVRCFVFLPVSEPYNRTLFTLPLKILSFVLREITREFLQQAKNHSCFVDSDFDVFVSSSIHTNCASQVCE